MELFESVQSVKGIGQKTLPLFKKLGINTVKDLLFYFPYSYKDYSHAYGLDEIPLNEYGFFIVQASEKPRYSRLRGNLSKTEFYGEIFGNPVKIIYFNRDYLRHSIDEAKTVFVYGRKEYSKGSISILASELFLSKPLDFEPMYRTTKGLAQSKIRNAVNYVLSQLKSINDYSTPFLEKYNILDIFSAIESMHRPKNSNDLLVARRRIAFDEQMNLNYILKKFDEPSSRVNSLRMRCSNLVKEFSGLIEFSLTASQISVMDEISKDLEGQTLMNRLIQGDVGCGKTIVAFFAVYCALKNNYQSVIMAPTEVLAQQHYKNALKYFNEEDITIITGSTRNKDKTKSDIKNNKRKIIIGTHALLFGMDYNNLGLVITDEQHKFGVKQRSKISGGYDVHSLILSATPIPRSLAMVLYGKSKISIIKDMPAGRKPVKTFLVPISKNKDMLGYIRKLLLNGDQAYIICPLIKENANDMFSVDSTYEMIRKYFSDIKVETLHGKMSAETKNHVLTEFSNGNIQLLISTTVVEVGIDVPNASIMCIYNAERFGLAQLHQLRGRIGRGNKESMCFIISGSSQNNDRLKILEQTNNGFEIAQKDLELRGSGDLLGYRQHGFVSFSFKSIIENHNLFDETRMILENLSKDDNFSDDYNFIVRSAEEKFLKEYVDIVLN